MKVKAHKIEAAVQALNNGGVVVFPTETSYGLAADATNADAVRKLNRLKGRGRKSLPLIASSLAMVMIYAKLTPLMRALARRFWPGPLTMVLPVKDAAKTQLAAQCLRGGKVAIRVSSNQVATTLSAKLGRPIVATSANRSGEPDVYSIPAFRKQYQGLDLLPDVIIDVGVLPKREPSTIVTEVHHSLKVLREGPIKLPQKNANFS